MALDKEAVNILFPVPLIVPAQDIPKLPPDPDELPKTVLPLKPFTVVLIPILSPNPELFPPVIVQLVIPVVFPAVIDIPCVLFPPVILLPVTCSDPEPANNSP
jgi:hypothetical protein